jgi:hypothetical protein
MHPPRATNEAKHTVFLTAGMMESIMEIVLMVLFLVFLVLVPVWALSKHRGAPG